MASSFGMAYPPVYVMSQIPHLCKFLKNIAPENVPIKSVTLPDKFDKELILLPEQIQFLKDAEVLVGDGTLLAKIYNSLPKLKWVHCTWAGIEPVMAAVERDQIKPSFTLTRHGCLAFSSLMAEYVICQIVNWEKEMRLLWKSQIQKTWTRMDRFDTCRSLNDLVVGVLGVGNMGCGVAKYLKTWDTRMLGFARTPRPPKATEFSFFDVISTDLVEILSECDYLCNTLPNTPQTSGLLNENVLSLCKKKPVFINVGRGSIIEEKYIIQAINNGWISGAVLDVFEKEPLPETSKLWDMPEVIITPHIAAVSTPQHVAEAFMKNYNKYVAGETLESVVNWSAGY